MDFPRQNKLMRRRKLLCNMNERVIWGEKNAIKDQELLRTTWFETILSLCQHTKGTDGEGKAQQQENVAAVKTYLSIYVDIAQWWPENPGLAKWLLKFQKTFLLLY